MAIHHLPTTAVNSRSLILVTSKSEDMRMLWRSKIANDERGATAIEYGLIAALIGLGIVGGVSGLGGGVAALWASVLQQIQSAL